MRFRKLSGLLAGALVGGVLAAPGLVTPAQATTTEDVAFTCTSDFGPVAYTTDINLAAVWNKTSGRATLTAELDDFPNGAPIFVTEDDQAQSAKLVTKIDSATTATNLIGSTVADFAGGTPIAVPTLAAAASAKGTSLSVVVQSFELTAGDSVFSCTPNAAVDAMVVPITFPTGSELNYVCSFGANKFAYMTDATVTGVQRGANIRATVGLENMPNTAPVFVTLADQLHTATLAMTANGGSSVNAVGTRTADFKGGVPVIIPSMTYDFASTADTVTLVADAFTVQVGASTTIPCTIDAPVSLTPATVTDYVAVASTTTLAATSAAANTAALAATVTPADAVGKVEFYEGATKVGEDAVASGAASASLAGVAAGAHSFTAKFVPTEAWAFATSTSSAAAVTVADPPVTGPSAECVAAGTATTKAAGVVKKATAASKKATAAVKKAAAAVKKATKSKNKKKVVAAKKALKKAKLKAVKSAKLVKSAKKAAAKAAAAEKTAC